MVENNPIVLYDGVCGLCNRLVKFLLKHDAKAVLRYASLQSEFAAAILSRHNLDPRDLDTVYVVLDFGEPSERVLARSDAILKLLVTIGGVWRLGTAGRILPRFIRDSLYSLVARNRYRVFGKYDTCVLPDEEHRRMFLDQ